MTRFKAVLQKRGIHRDGRDRLVVEVPKDKMDGFKAGDTVLVRQAKKKKGKGA